MKIKLSRRHVIRITRIMVYLKQWTLHRDLFDQIEVKRTRFDKLHRWMLKHQDVDNLKHAPCCPANHFHRARLVFKRCTCGAKREMYDWTK